MFFIDKFRPTCVDDIQFHHDIYDLLTTISHDNEIPHLIFYGNEGSGKQTMIQIFLKMIFDETVENTMDVEYDVCGSGNKKTKEFIRQSPYHIEIEAKNTNHDRYVIHDVVKTYAKRKTLNVYKTKKNFKIIYIKNIDELTYYGQTALRRIMERYNDKCVFIMCCKTLSKVIKPLQSRCICLRIPSPDVDEIKTVATHVCKQEGIKVKNMDKLIEKSNGNLKTLLWELEYIKQEYEFDTNYQESIRKIIAMLTGKAPLLEQLAEIKLIIHSLMIANITSNVILNDIVNGLCNSNISDVIKEKIILEAANIDCDLSNSRRAIVHFNTMMVFVIDLLSKSVKK